MDNFTMIQFSQPSLLNKKVKIHDLNYIMLSKKANLKRSYTAWLHFIELLKWQNYGDGKQISSFQMLWIVQEEKVDEPIKG